MDSNKRLKPLPKRSDEGIQEQLIPHYAVKAANDGIYNRNRGNDLSQKSIKDNTANFTIGLKDIDEAIKFYFEKVIKPTVVQNGGRVKVPVIYGNQEIWKTIQADGFMRDTNGRLMTPLITFERVSLSKNRDLGNKLDGNKAHLYQIFEKKYTKQNYYDHFSVLNNRIPVKEFITTVIPDYVTVNYNCIIFTEYIEQMNSLIESINYSSDSYWGDLSRFKFRARIDDFTNLTQFTVGQDRAAKSTFNITLNGYIIPETLNQEISTTKKFFSRSQIVFSLETSTNDIETLNLQDSSQPQSANLGSTSLIENNINISNVVNNNITNINNALQDDLIYLNTNVTVIASNVTSNTATFSNVNVLQPIHTSVLPPTSKSNFTFFANTIPIPANAIVSISETGNQVFVVFDNTVMDYLLISSDEVIAVGKFKSV